MYPSVKLYSRAALIFAFFLLPRELHVWCAGSFLFQGLSVALPAGAHCAYALLFTFYEALEDYRLCQAGEMFFGSAAKTLMGV